MFDNKFLLYCVSCVLANSEIRYLVQCNVFIRKYKLSPPSTSLFFSASYFSIRTSRTKREQLTSKASTPLSSRNNPSKAWTTSLASTRMRTRTTQTFCSRSIHSWRPKRRRNLVPTFFLLNYSFNFLWIGCFNIKVSQRLLEPAHLQSNSISQAKIYIASA